MASRVTLSRLFMLELREREKDEPSFLSVPWRQSKMKNILAWSYLTYTKTKITSSAAPSKLIKKQRNQESKNVLNSNNRSRVQLHSLPICDVTYSNQRNKTQLKDVSWSLSDVPLFSFVNYSFVWSFCFKPFL